MMIPAMAGASDSLRTVTEFGNTVMNNLLLADTSNGNDRLSSSVVQRCVRDAAGEVGNLVGTEKAKSITTTSGTWGYEVEKDLNSIVAVAIRNDKFAKAIIIYPFEKLIESYYQQSYSYDTASYFGVGVHGDSIYPYPIPSRVDTLIVIYRGSGTKVSAASDTVNLRYKYYPAVEYLATSKAAAIIKNYDAAKFWQGLFNGVIGGAK
jgi:hypothetical protein